MSRTLLRRLRGVAGTMLTWSVGGWLAGAMMGAGISLADLLPRGEAMHFRELVIGVGLGGAITGAVSGLAFALVLAVAERRRSFDELRTWRVGASGAAAALVMGWLTSREPGFAAICGTVGFGVAATSLLVARRALVAAESVSPRLPSSRVPAVRS